MAGAVRLFALSEQGLLFEVAPELADELRATRPIRHVNLSADVLLSDAEIAELAAEEKAQRERAAHDAARSTATTLARQSALAKLADLGLTEEEIDALRGR